MNKKYILLLVLLILCFGSYFYYFNFQNKTNLNIPSNENNDNPIQNFFESRKKFENPLTGEIIFSESRPEFLDNKPLAVMVNNATPARPQAGLTKADLVYEIVAEGGITRFLAVYLSELPERVGPIRSVREYYLVLVKELGDAMLMHIGYSPQALKKISDWNILSLGLSGADFYRDNRGNIEVATEHTAFASGKDLFTFGKAINFNNVKEIQPWKFNEKTTNNVNGAASLIKVDFWYEGEYSAVFKYDISKNEYIRYSGVVDNTPQILIDDLTKTEVRVKNLIIQFADEVPIPNDDKGRLDYVLLGEGDAIIFRDGKFINSKWKKTSLTERTVFYDLQGKEIEFNRGKIWVSVVPSRNVNQVKFTE
jgi:hypothetical protein